MKGDFTRDTFKPEKHYRQVLMQQGRVQLDADWNEQAAIAARRDETTAADLIGDCGGPAEGAAFAVITDPAKLAALPAHPTAPIRQFALSAGRYYVEGIQCEVEAPCLFSWQPDHRESAALPAGNHLIYLDVWQRHLTVLDDGAMREAALGGPDTATRAKTVWQVRAVPTGAASCGDAAGDLAALQRAQLPQLKARTAPGTPDTDPCVLPASAGYRGLENQLYRVEIHKPGQLGTATFKWSRENASVVTAITDFTVSGAGSILTVASTGPDDVLGFKDGDIVEVLDEHHELEGLPGFLVAIDGTPADNRIKLKVFGGLTLPGTADLDLKRHAKLRRWEGMATVAQPAANDGYLALEQGVEVRFDAVGDGCRTGDYWIIPARTATADATAGDIEWPREPDANGLPQKDKPIAQPPRGIIHHYCRLGIVTVKAGGTIDANMLQDCRCLWPALTAVPRLFYVSGDGQEVMPDLTQPAQFFKLPQPLIVGIANAHCLRAPLKVRFTALAAPGAAPVSGRVGPKGAVAPGGTVVEVATDAAGLAGCEFFLAAAPPSQQVVARLLDADGDEVSLPVIFNANLSLASRVAYQPGACDLLKPARDVQTALDILCASMGHGGCCVVIGRDGDFPTIDEALKNLFPKNRDLCLCLQPGDHKSGNFSLANDGKGALHLRIAGCGRGTRLRLEKPAVFKGLTSVTLRELAIFSGANLDNGMAALVFDSCEEVNVSGCRIAGVTEPGALLAIRDADRVRLADNHLEAALKNSLGPTTKVFGQPTGAFLADLFGITDRPKFDDVVADFGSRLARSDAPTRSKIQGELRTALATPDLRTVLSTGELLALARLNLSLVGDAPDAGVLADALGGIRTAGIKARAGLAVVVGEGRTLAGNDAPGLAGLDDDDFLLLENNEIIGVVCLMGQPEGNSLNGDEIRKLTTLLKATPATVQISGVSGGFQLRGNQLTRLAVAQRVVDQVRQVTTAGSGTITNVFGRCTVTDNTFEDGLSQIVCQQFSLTSNKFTFSARPPAAVAVTFVPSFIAGTSLADNAVFLGNQARGQRVFWQDVSRISDKAANVEINIA